MRDDEKTIVTLWPELPNTKTSQMIEAEVAYSAVIHFSGKNYCATKVVLGEIKLKRGVLILFPENGKKR